MKGSQCVSSDIQGGERENWCSVCHIFGCHHVSWLQSQGFRHFRFHEGDAGAVFVQVMRPRLVSLVNLGKSRLVLACVHLFVFITLGLLLLRHRLVWDILESSTSLVVRSFSATLSRMVVASAICTYFLSVSMGRPFDVPLDSSSFILEAFGSFVCDVPYNMTVVALSRFLAPGSISSTSVIVVLFI